MPIIGRSVVPHLRAGLRWWRDELAQLAPECFRRALAGMDSKLVLIVAGAGPFELTYEARGRRWILGYLDPAAPAGHAAEGIAGAARTWRGRVNKVCVRIGSNRALRTVATLPLAAERNLAQVLSFELDQQTPFRAKDAHFTYRVLRRDAAARRLMVELTVVPRDFVDGLVEIASSIGLRPDAIEVESADGGQPALLRGRRLSRAQRIRRHLLASLAGLAVVLAVVALVIPVQSAHLRAQALAEQLAEVKQRADAATHLQKDIETQIQEGHALLARKREAPSASRVLYALTHALADDTWLTDLSISGTDVQITGTAASASDLITRLGQAQNFANAAFRSTVTKDPKTNREQFSLSASIVPEVDR
jgi:general secretion pathway protein L